MDMVNLHCLMAYKEGLDNAIASVEIEGYRVTDEQKSQCFDFLSGKIDKDTFIQTVLKGCEV